MPWAPAGGDGLRFAESNESVDNDIVDTLDPLRGTIFQGSAAPPALRIKLASNSDWGSRNAARLLPFPLGSASMLVGGPTDLHGCWFAGKFKVRGLAGPIS